MRKGNEMFTRVGNFLEDYKHLRRMLLESEHPRAGTILRNLMRLRDIYDACKSRERSFKRREK